MNSRWTWIKKLKHSMDLIQYYHMRMSKNVISPKLRQIFDFLTINDKNYITVFAFVFATFKLSMFV